MRISLSRIEGVQPEWETTCHIWALVVGGRSPALDALATWKRDDPKGYKKIMATLRMIAEQGRVHNQNRVKPCGRHSGVFEARAPGSAPRLFFFYAEDDTLVVCTNAYEKKKSSSREQDKAFGLCAEMRDRYLAASDTNRKERRGKIR